MCSLAPGRPSSCQHDTTMRICDTAACIPLLVPLHQSTAHAGAAASHCWQYLQFPVPSRRCVLEDANAHFSFKGVVVSTLSPAKYIAIASAVVASCTPAQDTYAKAALTPQLYCSFVCPVCVVQNAVLSILALQVHCQNREVTPLTEPCLRQLDAQVLSLHVNVYCEITEWHVVLCFLTHSMHVCSLSGFRPRLVYEVLRHFDMVLALEREACG